MSSIVLGFDDSHAARAARAWAIDHALVTGSELMVVYVASSIAEWELAAVQIDPDPVRREYERRLNEEWTAPVRAAAVPYHTTVRIGRAAAELMHVARSEEARLIVIGMTVRGTLSELVFGSVHHELSHHAVRPVVAVPASWSPQPGG